ncbi:MAG: hypothetical protein AAGG48_02150 [Planctomycetota bacterium]
MTGFHSKDSTIQGNPYRAPVVPVSAVHEPQTEEQETATNFRGRTLIWWIVSLYPIWLVGSFYAVWGLAWVQLGHQPRPMLDDPKSIGGLMDLAYPIPGFLLLGVPVLTPLGFVAAFFHPFRVRPNTRFKLCCSLGALYVALCVSALILLRADFGSVIEWWFD